MRYLHLIISCIGLRILRKGEDLGIIGWTDVYLLLSRKVRYALYDSIREIFCACTFRKFPTYFKLYLLKKLVKM